jgi:DNA polymerase (family 10)
VDNATVAKALSELADLLELGEKGAFKVRAFRTAARAVEGLGEKVTDLANAGRLKEVRGIGEGVAKRIDELIATGKIAEAEAERAKLPPGLVALMDIPGVGLKTAQQVWKERAISSIDELEAAAKDGRLRDLPRFGEKREEKLIAAIAAFRKRAAAPRRRTVAEALALAEVLIERMRAVPGVVRCEYAGSLRRRAETVGDLDILVAASAAAAPSIMDAFARSPNVAEVLGRGDTKTSVVLAGGMQADLRVIAPEAWGAALQYFTGSKDHNVAMRTIAVKKGLKVSEYGVFDAGGAKIAGEDEEGVYAAIGLAWMEPELRENRGEIEAAAARRLPELVRLEDLHGDLHMHTTESDGKASALAMARGARAAGRAYVAITEHSESLTIARGLTRERLRVHVDAIRKIDDVLAGEVRVLAGVETDILADGALDLVDELDGLDWVIGSVHSQLGMPGEEITKRVVRAIESGKIDCLGHPTGRQLGVREPSALDMEPVLRALARAGAAIELNSSPLRLDVNEHWAAAARDLGVPVVLNSDAHSVRELEFLRYGVGIARRAWLMPAHVLNTRTVDELRRWRAERRA